MNKTNTCFYKNIGFAHEINEIPSNVIFPVLFPSANSGGKRNSLKCGCHKLSYVTNHLVIMFTYIISYRGVPNKPHLEILGLATKHLHSGIVFVEKWSISIHAICNQHSRDLLDMRMFFECTKASR